MKWKKEKYTHAQKRGDRSPTYRLEVPKKLIANVFTVANVNSKGKIIEHWIWNARIDKVACHTNTRFRKSETAIKDCEKFLNKLLG